MLHDSLRTLTEDASRLLEDLLAAGAEIPFEVGESGSGASPGMQGSVTMFAYRPLTAEFVSTHADQLRSLPGFEGAAQNLARTRGVIAYLRVQNEPVLDVGELTHARLGVLAFLAAVWNDAERFEHWGDRFERAYSDLESIVLAERLVTTVFIPIHGVALSEGSINLGGGVELIAAAELDPECADRFSDAAAGADSFCSVSITSSSDAPTPMPAVRHSARSLLTALRLFRPGSVALAMTAQADIAGSWHQVSMPFSGRSREDAWLLTPGDEEELRQFVSAVRRVERRTRIAWSLKRFETGLERTVPADGLTDFLLALGALLEADQDRGRAAMPARISALCAQENERLFVREEIEAAFALERLAINGHVGRADRKRLEQFAPLELIAATERHLRALLHDLVCGYLSTDLKALADEILTADGQPAGDEIAATEPAYLEPVPAPGEPAKEDPTQTVEFDAVFDDTAEIKAIDMREDVAAFRDEATAGTDAGTPEDNVWTLRPASEIAPAPEVTPEPVQESAPELAPALSPAFAPIAAPLPEPAPEPALATPGPEPALEAPVELSTAPAWEASPARRPVSERPSAGAASPAEHSGFTFDFQPVTEPIAQAASAPTPRRDTRAPSLSDSLQQSVEIGDETDSTAFPIPEFGVPTGRGPAALRSDEEVHASEQLQRLRAIMDEAAPNPRRARDEQPSTPVVQEQRAHLAAVERPKAAPEAPRITPPRQADRPLIPLDPQLTVEYDVLGEETSAEEVAQLAWSEQFVRREAEQHRQAEPAPAPLPEPAPRPQPVLQSVPAPEPAPELAPPRLLPVEPTEEIVVARFSEPVREVGQAEHTSEGDRDMRIGPRTVEFRPVTPPNPDEPDDFSGAC